MKFVIILQNLEKRLFIRKMKYKIEILYFVVIGDLYYLIERQKGKSILDVFHHKDFDSDNSDFIKDYFINHKFLD